jgi:hypothetical protein
MELRYTKIIGFYLRSEKNIFLLRKGNDMLPAKFFLVYQPNIEAHSTRVQKLLDAGYYIRWTQDFIKRPGDPRGLRLVLLENGANQQTSYRLLKEDDEIYRRNLLTSKDYRGKNLVPEEGVEPTLTVM